MSATTEQPADVADTLTPAPAVLITEECPECGLVVEGTKSGGNGAAFKLARHRRNEHQVQGKKIAARRAAKAKTAPDDDPKTAPVRVLESVREVATAVGTRRGAPTAGDLANGLGRGLGLSTTAVAAFMVESDPNIPEGPQGDQLRDGLVEYLSLSNTAAVGIMAPVGRALAPTKLNKRYGRAVIDNVDVAGSVAELGILAMHWRKYLRSRSAGAPGAVVASSPLVAPAPGPFGTVEQAGMQTTPPPTAGVVVDADMVERMQREAVR